MTSNDKTLAKQVFLHQLNNPVKGDWSTTVQKDLNELKITLSFFDISTMSKYSFKNMIKNACIKTAFKYLLTEKFKLSKGSGIEYTQLKTQNYLQPDSQLLLYNMRNIFMIRLRNLPIKCNFPSMYKDRKCISPRCSDEESQIHIYSCKYLEDTNMICDTNTKYSDVFSSDVQKQYKVMQIMRQHYINRQKILSS